MQFNLTFIVSRGVFLRNKRKRHTIYCNKSELHYNQANNYVLICLFIIHGNYCLHIRTFTGHIRVVPCDHRIQKKRDNVINNLNLII